MDPFVGEIRLFSGNYAPSGWLLCDGRAVSLRQYAVLFSLIGTTYGGDGVSNFCLPDLKGRVPIGSGQGTGLQSYAFGAMGGTQSQSLVAVNLPIHTHPLSVSSNPATASTPGPEVTFGTLSDPARFYVNTTFPTTKVVNYSAQAISTEGGSEAHDNTMPVLAMTYIVCYQGLYPDFD